MLVSVLPSLMAVVSGRPLAIKYWLALPIRNCNKRGLHGKRKRKAFLTLNMYWASERSPANALEGVVYLQVLMEPI